MPDNGFGCQNNHTIKVNHVINGKSAGLLFLYGTENSHIWYPRKHQTPPRFIVAAFGLTIER